MEKASHIEDSHEYRYAYDKRGNLTLEENCERTTQGNKWITEANYAYNAANRLSIGTNAKGEKSVYTYNGLGQRVRNEYIVQDNGYDYTTFDCTPPSVEVGFETPEVIIRDFVIDQTSPIEEVLVESEKDGFDYRYTVGLDRISVNVLSPDPDTNHERTQTATKQWLHSDRLGSTVNSTDSFGRVTERTDYNEWGEITFHEKIQNVLGYRTINTDQTYTNHDYDVVLGLYYAKARMYDPREKRFSQRDLYSGDISVTLSLVSYIYVLDNPTGCIDPLGLKAEVQTNPHDLIKKAQEGGFNYRTIRGLFGDNGIVGGEIDSTFAPVYICRVRYNQKEFYLSYNLSDLHYSSDGIAWFTGKVSQYTGRTYRNEAYLGTVSMKFNRNTNTSAVYVNTIEKYFEKIWCESNSSSTKTTSIINKYSKVQNSTYSNWFSGGFLFESNTDIASDIGGSLSGALAVVGVNLTDTSASQITLLEGSLSGGGLNYSGRAALYDYQTAKTFFDSDFVKISLKQCGGLAIGAGGGFSFNPEESTLTLQINHLNFSVELAVEFK